MWILPKNYPLSSVFVADMVESKEDLILPALNIESSLMWRSKPSALKTWQRRWTKDSWMSHLFTRILKPSHQKSFETKLASSLEAIHVSRLVGGHRRGAKDPRHLWPYIRQHINAIRPIQCFFENVEGHISLGLSTVVSDLEEDGYRTTGEYSQRRKLALLTEESEYIFWPTVTVNGNYNRKGSISLLR